MGEVLTYQEFKNQSHFKIQYPYYGLFGTADITAIDQGEAVVFRCQLLNGTILFLKKLTNPRKWIDVNLNLETPLSAVIGNSIDDFFSKATK